LNPARVAQWLFYSSHVKTNDFDQISNGDLTKLLHFSTKPRYSLSLHKTLIYQHLGIIIQLAILYYFL